MKTITLVLALLFSLAGLAGAGNAWADRGHVHLGVTIGPYWGPWYYPPLGYYPYTPYYAPVVVERPAPQVYVEQQPVVVAPTAANYWYYCAAARGYYPYVKECPGGWQKVSPQPTDQH